MPGKLTAHTFPSLPIESPGGRNGGFACEFCGVFGSRPECEGELLGPFVANKIRAVGSYFVHRNCATWAPEVYEQESGVFGIEEAIARSRRKNCSLCGGKGPSLSCMYLMTQCCKPMHFRCALIAGAALMAFDNAFHTLCPKHIAGTFLPNAAPHIREVLHVQTPVFPEELSPESLCYICRKDNYKTALGAIMHCSSCSRRMHSKCVTPVICPDGVFAVDAADGKFRCNNCLTCVDCKESIPGPPRPNAPRDAPNVLRCVVCKCSAMHKSCFEKRIVASSRVDADGALMRVSSPVRFNRNVRTKKPSAAAHVFRCQSCRSCRHCGQLRVEFASWNEELEACQECAELYVVGFPKGHVCPICDKIDREDEDIDMIHCDSCQRWVHAVDCCGLEYEEFVRLERDEAASYFCPRCEPPDRPLLKKTKKKRRLAGSRSKDAPDVDDADGLGLTGKSASEIAAAAVSSADVKAAAAAAAEAASRVDVEELDDEADQDAVMWLMGKVKADGKVNPVPEFAVQRDLCRACGSGGNELSLRFCSDCGESVHGFCLPGNLPQRWRLELTRSLSEPSRRRLSCGSPEGIVALWQCPRCVVCSFCSKGPSDNVDGTSFYSSQPLYRCTHCDAHSHFQCMSRAACSIAEDHIDHETRTMLCADCLMCELCRTVCLNPVQEQDMMFCETCAGLVRNSKPCSICAVKYPNMPPVSSSSSAFGYGSVVLPPTPRNAVDNSTFKLSGNLVPQAHVCNECNAAVHTICCVGSSTDIGVHDKSQNPTYVCAPCRQVSSGASHMQSSKSSGKCVGEGMKSTYDRTNVCADDNQEGLLQGVNYDDAICADSDRGCALESESERNGECQGGSDDDELWALGDVQDNRVCEFCGGPESSHCQKGRLIPWVAEKSLWWAHAMCALWSPSVKRQIGMTETGVRVCFLVGSRKVASRAIRTGICVGCERDGATIACLTADCDSRFHYSCAQEAGCVMQARTVADDDDSPDAIVWGSSGQYDAIDLAAVSGLSMLCVQCYDGSDISTIADDCSAGSSVTLSSGRRLDLNLSVRFYAGTSQLMNRKCSANVDGARYSLRVGGLTVVRPGVVVPNSALFLHDGILIPNEFRAARRHWSITHPGRRCTYMLATTGSARSGPTFSIRASDDRDLHVCAPSPSAAWNVIAHAIQSMRSTAMGDSFSELAFVRLSGIKLFGLANCPPSVSLIESLPNSHLFQGRYDFEYYNPPASLVRSLPFALPNLSLHQTSVVLSGSARTEGYVPQRHPSACQTGAGPSYANVRSGEWFQLHVAMGVGQIIQRKVDNDPGQLQNGGDTCVGSAVASVDCGSFAGGLTSGDCVDGGDAIAAGTVATDSSRVGIGRVSKCRMSGGSAGVNGVNDGTRAMLPYAMQHRSMLRTWQRRTVVLRSRIEGWGVFATEDIMAQEMVIEYAGEVIRPVLSDKREKYYDSKGIGCYMFEIAPGVIVDATVTGNRARYINHSCDPNCFSRTVTVENGRRVIVIFSKRQIKRGEELCYDYQFPFDDNDRVECACGAARCKGWMN
jgi:SET domain/PHD-zinc-finger like domain/F/Y rich C-terminus/PHD-like zinc-binding domain/PHD-finger/F/Y-rich N-terminus